MKSLNPYLCFFGKTREALDFYASCFPQAEVSTQTFAEAKIETPPANRDDIIHAEFKADGLHFMASDGMPGQQPMIGNMVSLCIQLSSETEQTAIFNALAKGGKITMPLDDTFWGARFGMLTDRYGIDWMLNCPKAQ